ncbi:MAG: sulfotransferase family 2 domain-containing protein [Prosthecobacter sp.]
MKLAQTWRQFRLRFPEPLFKLLTGRKRDVLFLWVPKCAGTSVYRALVKYNCVQERWLMPMVPFSNRGIITFGHVDVLQLIERGVVTRRYFDNAFKFGFVRNPFDRMVSLFFYLKKIKCEEVSVALTFEDFCRKVDRQEHPPVGLYNYKGLNQCNPMVDWLTDRNGKLIADFVGRHENVNEDFRKICQIIGISEKIPHKNKTDHRPYREYYNDETRSIVEKLFRRDLDLFGYEF